MQTSLPAAKYQDVSARRGFYQRVIDGVTALPGVEAAAYVLNSAVHEHREHQRVRHRGADAPTG